MNRKSVGGKESSASDSDVRRVSREIRISLRMPLLARAGKQNNPYRITSYKLQQYSCSILDLKEMQIENASIVLIYSEAIIKRGEITHRSLQCYFVL
jgi:hypothetical protein